jgi:steroid delta-isomerase-like uncharacterized protein
MTPEIIIHRYFEDVWNKGNLNVLDEIIAPDYINHSSSMPNQPSGPDGLKPIVAAMRQAFTGLHYTLHDIVVGEGKVAIRCTMSGKHTGDFFGIPPTGKEVSITQFQIEYIRDGKIVEHWRQSDDLTLMKQLGLVS